MDQKQEALCIYHPGIVVLGKEQQFQGVYFGSFLSAASIDNKHAKFETSSAVGVVELYLAYFQNMFEKL